MPQVHARESEFRLLAVASGLEGGTSASAETAKSSLATAYHPDSPDFTSNAPTIRKEWKSHRSTICKKVVRHLIRLGDCALFSTRIHELPRVATNVSAT